MKSGLLAEKQTLWEPPQGWERKDGSIWEIFTYANEQHLRTVTLQKIRGHSVAKGSENTEDLEQGNSLRLRNREEEVQWLWRAAVTKARGKTREKEPSEASVNTWECGAKLPGRNVSSYKHRLLTVR